MKILAMYEGIVGLFPKKVLVTLIHATNNEALGDYKMAREQLPEIFNKPTILKMEDRSWRIVKANPFLLEGVRKLTLHVIEPTASLDKFTVPTRSYPPSVLMENPASDLFVNMPLEDWRQLELLPVAQLELIQEQIAVIESMLDAVKEDDGLLGYETIYERVDIEGAGLNIPFDEFFQFVNGLQKGHVQNVADSFVIRSENYQYYGIVKAGIILNLCLIEFDSAEDEFAGVAEKYELLLVDWCSGKIIF